MMVVREGADSLSPSSFILFHLMEGPRLADSALTVTATVTDVVVRIQMAPDADLGRVVD